MVDGVLGMMNGTSYSGILAFDDNTLYLGYASVTHKTTINGREVGIQTSGDGLTRLFVNLYGNVGIGTTNPQCKLDVNGLGRFIDGLYVYGTELYVDTKAGFTGNVNINGAVTMASTLKVDSYIDITGTSRLRGNVTMDGDVHMGNNKGFYFKNSAGSGALSLFLSSSNVLGIAHSNIASVNIGVATTIEGALTVGAGATINGNLVVAGDISA